MKKSTEIISADKHYPPPYVLMGIATAHRLFADVCQSSLRSSGGSQRA